MNEERVFNWVGEMKLKYDKVLEKEEGHQREG